METNDIADVLPLSQLVEMMRAFICQRPGFEPANYCGNHSGYRADSRQAQQQRADALTMLASFERVADWGVNAADASRMHCIALLDELTYGGRLSFDWNNGKPRLDYCTGQYWPTEFRAGVCRVLASALWKLQRDSMNAPTGDSLRASFVRQYGRGLAGRWFR